MYGRCGNGQSLNISPATNSKNSPQTGLQTCNHIPDIDVVVQWKLPGSVSVLVQRAGRAARGRDRVGIAILLVEPSAYTTDLTKEVETRAPKAQGKKAAANKETESDAAKKGKHRSGRLMQLPELLNAVLLAVNTTRYSYATRHPWTRRCRTRGCMSWSIADVQS